MIPCVKSLLNCVYRVGKTDSVTVHIFVRHHHNNSNNLLISQSDIITWPKANQQEMLFPLKKRNWITHWDQHLPPPHSRWKCPIFYAAPPPNYKPTQFQCTATKPPPSATPGIHSSHSDFGLTSHAFQFMYNERLHSVYLFIPPCFIFIPSTWSFHAHSFFLSFRKPSLSRRHKHSIKCHKLPTEL